jgi:membrane protein DedA with SNARE-associated domain
MHTAQYPGSLEMETFLHVDIGELITKFGYLGVFALIFFECAGVPLPGEMALVSASIFAGTSSHMHIELVILAAATAAILGDNMGFWFGRRYGIEFLHRFGPYIHLTEPRLKIGQMLFQRHGGKVVFLGRFTALLRTYAAMLAGANRFPPRRFFVWNAGGGISWAVFYGLGGYFFGHSIAYFAGPVSIGLLAAVVIGVVVILLLVKRHERRWVAEANRSVKVD